MSSARNANTQKSQPNTGEVTRGALDISSTKSGVPSRDFALVLIFYVGDVRWRRANAMAPIAIALFPARILVKKDEIGNVAGVRPKSNCGRGRFRVYSFVRRECCSARPSPLGHYISSQLKRQRTGFSVRMNWSPDRPARWRFALFPASRQPTGNVIFGEDVSDRRADAMSSRRSESFCGTAL